MENKCNNPDCTFPNCNCWENKRRYSTSRIALLERKALLFDAVENAARDLPDGYEIRLEIQSGYGGLVVINPDGEEHQVDSRDREIAEQINDIVGELLKTGEGITC